MRLKEYTCAHADFGPLTTLNRCKPDVCAGHTPGPLPPQAPVGPRPPVRHLLYHVYPVKGNGVWQRNLDQLKLWLHLFNGVRAVAIATDARTDPPEAVREYLHGHVRDFLEVQNDGNLREVTTFVPLLERIAWCVGPEHYTFYAHAKGVTKPINPGVSVHPWVGVLYAANLDYWPLVQSQLAKHPITGAFKKVGRGFGSASSWHYSGTFYWLRNADVFTRRNWRHVDWAWWGTEAWPGLHFDPQEAGCLFHTGRVPSLNLYNLRYVTRTILPEFERWKREHWDKRTTAPA